MGLTYEEMRKFYEGFEQREQQYIVKIQQLMLENKKLKESKEDK